ncbi:MAG: hypothetical protein AAFU71_07075 [Cyanobacteria bacterium J06632_22]
MNTKLFFNSETNQVLRLPVNKQGLCQLDVGNRTFHLPVQALELLHYHPVSIDTVETLSSQAPALRQQSR